MSDLSYWDGPTKGVVLGGAIILRRVEGALCLGWVRRCVDPDDPRRRPARMWRAVTTQIKIVGVYKRLGDAANALERAAKL